MCNQGDRNISSGTKIQTDVLILGSGMAGTIAGLILSHSNVDVTIVDSTLHPRFAIGESTIPHTSLLLSLLAERYGIPELDYLAYPDKIAEHVCSTCGIKRSFGFAYHEQEKRYDHRHGLLFGTGSKDENHLFRQDTDAYLLQRCIQKGARVLLGEQIVNIEIDNSGVYAQTNASTDISAKFVIDATGYRSILAHKYGLRESPTTMQHKSRTLFTHMIDVGEFEELDNPFALPWNQNTLHHVFDGGWFWVIPFNNRANSTNPLVSVGLTLDFEKHPASTLSPSDEFKYFLKLFPSVKQQFRDAKPVRPWTKTGRIQYSSSACCGSRFALMSHSAGFVDPLFSRGLINSLEIIAALIEPLLKSLRDDDFSVEPLQHLNDLQQRVISYNDQLVHNAFFSWKSFELWNAWARVWGFGTLITEFRMLKLLSDFSAAHDTTLLKGPAKSPVFSDQEDEDYASLFSQACKVVQGNRAGNLSDLEAAATIFEICNSYPFPVELTVEGMQRAGWLEKDKVVSQRNMQAAREGFRWALGNPDSRDLFGTTDTFYRWRARQADPHL